MNKQIEDFPRSYFNLSVNEIGFGDKLAPASLNGIQFSKLDLSNTDLTDIELNECIVYNMVVNENTLFGHKLPKVNALLFESGESTKVYRNSEDIAKVLKSLSINSEKVSNWNQYKNFRFVKFFEKICRKASRTFYIKVRANNEYNILDDALWIHAHEILEQHNRVQTFYPPVSGPDAEMIHIIRPKDILDLSDDSDKIIFDKVIAKALEIE